MDRVRRFPRSEEGEIDYSRLAETGKRIADAAWVSPQGKFRTFLWTYDHMHPEEALKILGRSTKGMSEDQINIARGKALEDLLGSKWIRWQKNNVQSEVNAVGTEAFSRTVERAADWARERGQTHIYVDVGPRSVRLPIADLGEFLSDPMDYISRYREISENRPPGGQPPPLARSETAVA